MKNSLTIISGIVPGNTGVGRLMSYLVHESKLQKNKNQAYCNFIFRGKGISCKRYIQEGNYLKAIRDLNRWLLGNMLFRSGLVRLLAKDNVILIHPQTLGFKWCLNFIEKSKDHVWLYLMDCSFFCAKSYNYIQGKTEPCLKCLGGNFRHIMENNCLTTAPFADNDHLLFLEKSLIYAQRHKLKFLVQNVHQASMAKKHFGKNADIKIAGLWAADWGFSSISTLDKEPSQYDIVFHGAPSAAKGVFWVIRLAHYLPQYSFFFPFAKNKITSNITAPENCAFKKMSWESGLKEAVVNGSLTLVPSLWSAPIEGALIKSIVHAKFTAVITNKTSFSDELADNIIIKLSSDEKTAAAQINRFLSTREQPSKEEIMKFINRFKHDNGNLLSRLCHLAR